MSGSPSKIQESNYGSLNLRSELKKKIDPIGGKYQSLLDLFNRILYNHKARFQFKKGAWEYNNLAIADEVCQNIEQVVANIISDNVSSNGLEKELKKAIEKYLDDAINDA